jgi:predicted transcriptional regulator
VLENGSQVGCIDQETIAERLSDFEAEGRGDSGAFGELKISQVMGLPLPALQKASSLASPFGFFREHKAVLILEGKEATGILTLSDIVQYHLRS